MDDGVDEPEERRQDDESPLGPEGCRFPGKCCMPGPHYESECHTAEMLMAMEAQETGAPNDLRHHHLKTWPDFFRCIVSGEKTFELRFDDRGYRVGDVLVLREWRPTDKTFTGQEIRKRVTYTTSGFGLAPGWMAMGICDV